MVQIWAVLDSGAVSRLCSRAITSAAILLATWPLMNGLTGSDLLKVCFAVRYHKHNWDWYKDTIWPKYGVLIYLYRQVHTQSVSVCKTSNYMNYLLFTYLARSAFLSLHTAVWAVFFLSPLVMPPAVSWASVSTGGPTLTIRPDWAHLLAFLRAADASSVITSQLPL